MSQIGTLTGGAGAVTTINIQHVPEFIVIGSSYNAAGIVATAISWSIAGKEYVNVAGAALSKAFAKLKKHGDLTNGVVDETIQVGFGYEPNQQFQLRITNAGATTPAVYGFSRRMGNRRLLTAAPNVINDGASQSFTGFIALMFDATNLDNAEVAFRNAKTGAVYTERMQPAELLSLFGLDNISEAGTLAAITVIDNTNLLINAGQQVQRITLYASGGSITVQSVGIAKL